MKVAMQPGLFVRVWMIEVHRVVGRSVRDQDVKISSSREAKPDCWTTRTEGMEDDHPIILFDGVCNLCEGFVQFVIRNDPDAIFRFAPLQSSVGEAQLARVGIEDHGLDGVVLIENDRVYIKSDAVIRTTIHLGMPYRLLGPTKILPRRLRDFAYDVVAERRYGWFGQKDACLMPTDDIKSRFLAGAPGTESE